MVPTQQFSSPMISAASSPISTPILKSHDITAQFIANLSNFDHFNALTRDPQLATPTDQHIEALLRDSMMDPNTQQLLQKTDAADIDAWARSMDISNSTDLVSSHISTLSCNDSIQKTGAEAAEAAAAEATTAIPTSTSIQALTSTTPHPFDAPLNFFSHDSLLHEDRELAAELTGFNSNDSSKLVEPCKETGPDTDDEKDDNEDNVVQDSEGLAKKKKIYKCTVPGCKKSMYFPPSFPIISGQLIFPLSHSLHTAI
jgi:hypothetical protein